MKEEKGSRKRKTHQKERKEKLIYRRSNAINARRWGTSQTIVERLEMTKEKTRH